MAPLTPTQTTRPHPSPKSPRTLKWLLYAALSLCIALLVASFLPSTAQEETQAAQSQSSSGSVVVEEGANPSDDELAAAEYLAKQGHRVRLLARNPASADPQPDAQLDDDDFPTEIKTVGNITSIDVTGRLAGRIREALGQAPSVVIDARKQIGLTKADIDRALDRADGMAQVDGKVIKRIRVLGPNGEDITNDYTDNNN